MKLFLSADYSNAKPKWHLIIWNTNKHLQTLANTCTHTCTHTHKHIDIYIYTHIHTQQMASLISVCICNNKNSSFLVDFKLELFFIFHFSSFSPPFFPLSLLFFISSFTLFILKLHGCQCHHHTPMPNNMESLTPSSDPFIQEYIQTICFYRLHLRYLLFQAHYSDQFLKFSHSLSCHKSMPWLSFLLCPIFFHHWR